MWMGLWRVKQRSIKGAACMGAWRREEEEEE
jgi:hypothetical protein